MHEQIEKQRKSEAANKLPINSIQFDDSDSHFRHVVRLQSVTFAMSQDFRNGFQSIVDLTYKKYNLNHCYEGKMIPNQNLQSILTLHEHLVIVDHR